MCSLSKVGDSLALTHGSKRFHLHADMLCAPCIFPIPSSPVWKEYQPCFLLKRVINRSFVGLSQFPVLMYRTSELLPCLSLEDKSTLLQSFTIIDTLTRQNYLLSQIRLNKYTQKIHIYAGEGVVLFFRLLL